MRTTSLSKGLGIAVFCGAAFAAASPAAAGRCGHSYPVDSPTTLVEVARRCNVNLSALYEANPGVDPRNVRPGQHLAVPDEIDRYAPEWAGDAPPVETAYEEEERSTHPYIASYDYRPSDAGDTVLADERGYYWNASAAPQPAPQQAAAQSPAPVWLQHGSRTHAGGTRLSYQKLSALRIHNAGYVNGPVVLDADALPPETKLVQCRVLRDADGDKLTNKVHRLQNVFSSNGAAYVQIEETPDQDGFDCTLMSDASGLQPGVPAAHFNAPGSTKIYPAHFSASTVYPTKSMVKGNQALVTLIGDVVNVDDGCATVKTEAGDLWRVSAQSDAQALLGKNVTIWGRASKGGACGATPSIAISHAVYAEPW